MTKNYNTSWNLIDSDKGCLPIDEDAFDKIYKEWKTRNWPLWLKDHLTFPFTVERKEDDDDAFFTDIDKHEPFRLGRTMQVIGIDPEEDDHDGIVVHVREGKLEGYVPLCDLEVTARDDKNFWPVREYVVWFANR